MTTERFIAEALQFPATAISYHVSRRLRMLYPDKALLEGGDQFFNMELQPALRLSEAAAAQIAEQTEGFSFAYLKELFLSAMMRWIATTRPGTMEQVMGEQVDVLREQMVSTTLLPALEPGSESAGGMFPPQRRWMRPRPPHGGDDVPL